MPPSRKNTTRQLKSHHRHDKRRASCAETRGVLEALTERALTFRKP
jgi:hypothetical protein